MSHSLKKVGQRVSHESIYQWVIEDRRNGGDLYTHLRRRQRKYNRRHDKDCRRSFLRDRVPIEQRSKHVNNRMECAHWKADTVLGRKTQKPVLVTLVERKGLFY
ncbi:MAG TPA: IS30 family transposase [Candidatus Aphodousia faecavium]|nr:IS30 family transposase [Candidatus Aphodousia faecavium]